MASIWTARLLPASFRGIPFLIDSHELKGGRHAISHEPPDRNTNFAEDIGKKSKNFTVEAHVLGDNYFFIRDAIIKAMDSGGKGVLVHPYLGVKEVQPVGYTFREDTLEGRIARFTLEFVEAGKPSNPFEVLDVITGALTAIVGTIAQVKNAFLIAFKIAQLPAFGKEAASLFVGDFAQEYKRNLSKVKNDGAGQAQAVKASSDLDAQKNTLLDNPASLIQVIDDLIDLLSSVVPDVEEAPFSTKGGSNPTVDESSGRDDKLAVYNTFINFRNGVDEIPTDTATRQLQKESMLALANSINQLAILRFVEQLIAKQFKSIEEAIEKRNQAVQAIDLHLKKPEVSDEVFQGLSDVQARLIQAVPSALSDFANVRTVQLTAATPNIVLCYDLYESLANEQDVIDRNKVRHPGFVFGDLQVLSR